MLGQNNAHLLCIYSVDCDIIVPFYTRIAQ